MSKGILEVIHTMIFVRPSQSHRSSKWWRSFLNSTSQGIPQMFNNVHSGSKCFRSYYFRSHDMQRYRQIQGIVTTAIRENCNVFQQHNSNIFQKQCLFKRVLIQTSLVMMKRYSAPIYGIQNHQK